MNLIEFTEAEAGQTLYGFACWISTTGEQGPYTRTVMKQVIC